MREKSEASIWCSLNAFFTVAYKRFHRMLDVKGAGERFNHSSSCPLSSGNPGLQLGGGGFCELCAGRREFKFQLNPYDCVNLVRNQVLSLSFPFEIVITYSSLVWHSWYKD